MPDKSKSDEYQVIWLVRRLFRALGKKSNDSLEGLGVLVADRAVMEFLFPDKTLSVPEIAEKYKVSRQHIQSTVNSLIEKGLVVTQDNPRHKRSPLIALNKSGQALFKSILKIDMKAVDDLFSDIPQSDIKLTSQTLEKLLDKLT